MEIATGYFAKAKQYAGMGYALVSIARVAPWFLAKELNVYPLKDLAPTDEILALKDSPDEYTTKYRKEILKRLSPTRVFDWLLCVARQEQKNKVVLMCYEAPRNFCHRHLVANWLTGNLGIKVEEVALTKKPEQQDMFCEEAGT